MSRAEVTEALFELVSAAWVPLVAGTANIVGLLTSLPAPPCPPCSDDPVLCALRVAVSVARALVWGQPC
jgi:hypothetical protein